MSIKYVIDVIVLTSKDKLSPFHSNKIKCGAKVGGSFIYLFLYIF